MTQSCVARRRSRTGQSLVEYALAIGLVTVVVIAVAFVIGLGAERIFGIVGGAFGQHYDDHRQHTITIDNAQCIASKSQNLTGLWVLGETDVPLDKLTGSTNLGVVLDSNGAPSDISANGPGGYKFNPVLAYSLNLDACPKSVVIQASDGTEAVSPVTALTAP